MLKRRGPSRKFEAFLASEDLDDLLRARVALGDAGDRDRETILAILEDWSEPRAVSNLLFYPDLIPEGIRMSSVLRALDEEEMPYYRLAATVGLQEGLPMTRDERNAVADRFLKAIEEAAEVLREWEPVEGATTFDEVLAARASAALPGYVGSDDVPRLVAQLNHPDETVRANVLCSLLDLIGREEAELLIDKAVGSGALEPAARQFFAENLDPMMLWAYIPNLRDMYRREDAEAAH